MDNKFRWLLLLAAVLMIGSACSLFSKALNPADEIVSEIEDLSEQIDVQEIEKEIETLATELPSELGKIEDLDLGDLGDLEATAQAYQDEFISGEPPEDIPMVDEPREDLILSKEIVSYVTSLDLDTVLSFYQEQMPLNDWVLGDEGTLTVVESVFLRYEKPGREATISISTDSDDGKTFVMIAIQETE